MCYLVQSTLQVYGDGNPSVQFLQVWENRGHPAGADVVIIDVVQWVGVRVEAEHAVAGGVMGTIRNAVPFRYGVNSGVTGGAEA